MALHLHNVYSVHKRRITEWSREPSEVSMTQLHILSFVQVFINVML